MTSLWLTRFGNLSSMALAAIAIALSGCATNENPPAPVKASTPDYRYLIGVSDSKISFAFIIYPIVPVC